MSMLIFLRRRILHLRVRNATTITSRRTNDRSPVIVAEDMIGCAMYELVCVFCGFKRVALGVDSSRSVSATITSSVRSFESTAIRLLSRSTRRLVRLNTKQR